MRKVSKINEHIDALIIVTHTKTETTDMTAEELAEYNRSKV